MSTELMNKATGFHARRKGKVATATTPDVYDTKAMLLRR